MSNNLIKILGFIFALIFCSLFPTMAYAVQASGAATVTGTMTGVTRVKAYYIDGTRVPASCTIPPYFQIKKTQKVDCNCNKLTLSPVQLEFTSNTSGCMTVSAMFYRLYNGCYTFSRNNLSISPCSVTLKDKTKLTPKFTPYVKVGSDVKPGCYKGQIVFTLAEL